MTAMSAEPDHRDAEIVRLRARIEDGKTSAGAGMRLADELRAERDALAAGVPLVCSDERHKVKVFAQEMALERVRALHAYVEEAGYCDICSNHGDIGWPCATLRALDGEAS